MTQTRQSPGHDSRASSKTVTQTTTIVTRGSDVERRRAIRQDARRRLDELLAGGPAALVLGDPIDWRAVHMDLGIPERDLLGRELAVARG